MASFVYRDGKVIPKEEAEPYNPEWAVSIISDNMDPVKHHGTGRIIDSKAKFRADTRASGCVEIGNERIQARNPIALDRRQRREDIKRTIYNLRNGIK